MIAFRDNELLLANIKNIKKISDKIVFSSVMNILELIFFKKKTSYEISQENLKNIGEMVSTHRLQRREWEK